MALDLCAFGCVATTAEILEWEYGLHASVDIYLRSRAITRIRVGLYACAHLDADTLAALRAGGPLDCISALERAGGIATRAGLAAAPAPLAPPAPPESALTEVPPASELHVRYRRGDHWARTRITASERPIIAHWHEWRITPPTVRRNRILTRSRRPPVPLGHVPPSEAFAQSLLCLDAAHSLHVIDALASSELLPEPEIAAIIAAAPRRTQAALRQAGLALQAGPGALGG
jgi:hypothetical protein